MCSLYSVKQIMWLISWVVAGIVWSTQREITPGNIPIYVCVCLLRITPNIRWVHRDLRAVVIKLIPISKSRLSQLPLVSDTWLMGYSVHFLSPQLLDVEQFRQLTKLYWSCRILQNDGLVPIARDHRQSTSKFLLMRMWMWAILTNWDLVQTQFMIR